MDRTLADQRAGALRERRALVAKLAPRKRAEEPDRVVLRAVALPVASNDLLAPPRLARLTTLFAQAVHCGRENAAVLPRHGLAKGRIGRDLAQTVEDAQRRVAVQVKLPSGGDRLPAPDSDSPSEEAIVAKFVAAYESSDLDSLVALLTDDVFISMPPLPFEYQGREPAARFFASIFGSGRKFELLQTRANGQPALGAYVGDSTGISHGVGLFVLTLAGDEICAMTRFENTVVPWFGLPRSIPRR